MKKCNLKELSSSIITVLRRFYNWIKPCMTFNTASLFIAILAAYISYRTLDESIKQRESMYKPELRIGDACFLADIKDLDNIVYYKINKGIIDLSMAEKDAWFRINNIGMGSALSVSIKAHFNREEISPLLASLKAVEDDNEYSIFDTIRNSNDSIVLLNGEVTRNWRVDYIMPISQSEDECVQYFSRTGFKTFIQIFLWLKKAGQFEDSHDFLIPVELKYKDINGKLYSKEVDMLFKFSLVQGNPNKIVCQIKSGLPYTEEYEEFKKDLDNHDIIKVYKTY